MTPDLCIIGAGPAGIAAAREGLALGARVVLVERHALPGTKACGGGLTPAAMEKLGPFVADPVSCRRLFVNGPPGRHLIELDVPFMHVAERAHWTRAAIQELRDRGAVVYAGERCRKVEDGIVVTERRRIKTGLIIGADGPRSAVRRHLGLPSAVSVIARQIILPSSTPSAAALLPFCPGVWFDYGLFGPGYGWAFPLTDALKVGCGVSVHTHNAAALSLTFRQWLARLGIPMDAGIHQAGSIGCRYSGHRFGRIFLAGDAGGFADPITGEGISQALISGREVAKEALEPAYRSSALERLITSRRRTLELLFHPVIGRLLYDHTPLLLQSRWLAKKVMRRFVYSDAAMDRTSA